MGKKKASGNNDMTAILNQLQKTYSVDGDEDIFESESAYEDTELSDLLAKILSENSSEIDEFNDEEELDLNEDTSVKSKRKQKKCKKSSGSDVSTDIQNIIMSEEYISVLRECKVDLESGDEGADSSEIQEPRENSTGETQTKIDNLPSPGPDENIELQPKQSLIENIDADNNQAIFDETNDSDDSETLESVETDGQEDEVIGEDDNIDNNLPFGDLDDDESDVDDDLTFGDLDDDEGDVDDDLTFGDLDDDEGDVDDDLTFGDLDDDEGDVDDDLTFGDLDDDEGDVDDDLTFGDLDDDESDVDDDLTFGDLDDDESDIDDVGEPSDDVIEADIEVTIEDDIVECVDESGEPQYIDGHAVEPEAIQLDTEKKFYYTVLEQMSREDATETVDEFNEPQVYNTEDIADIEEEIQFIIQPKDDIYIVLSEDSYTDDPLQWHLDRVKSKLIDNVEDDNTQEASKKTVEMEDDDISLLLQLGYKDELKSEIGQERTDSVVHGISNSYRPDKNKIPFGFCGKEFFDSSQIDKIKQKYDYDKRMIVIKLALFSCISMVLLLLGLIFKNYTTVNSVIMFSVMELLITSLGCVVLYKELISGIKGVFKFSPTVFTMPIISLLVLTSFDIFNIISCIVKPNSITASTTSLFGFTTSVFFIFALAVELINCVREQKTFNLISASQDLYTAETLISQREDKSDANNLRSHEIRKQVKGNAVIVKKTRYISEYFKRCSESSYGIGNIMLVLGVVPLAAMILACIIIAMGRTASDVASTVVFAFYMCLSASFVLIMPVTLFAASQSLAERKCGIIGTGSVAEYADTNSVIFPDTSAFKIDNDIEVVPFGDVDMNSAMKTANRLFSALGGTMSDILGENPFNKDLSVSEAEINIASVDNNGIELYMDNETHILLGNEKFVYERRRQLNFEACDFIPAAASSGREVVYLAINGVVSLGYIMYFDVKTEFTDNVKLLALHSIRTYVSTYEPHIKAKRYNNCKIGVYRPYDHESSSKPTSRYGGIVASGDAKNITYPLIMTSEVLQSVRKSSKVSVMFILAGIVVSFAITLVGYIAPGALGILRYRDIFTVIIQLLSVIPLTVSAIKLWKKYK